MKITWERWIVASALACGLIGAVLLPSRNDEKYGDRTLYRWQVDKYNAMNAISQRRYRRLNHEDGLWHALRARLMIEQAQRILAGRSENAGEPFVWIDNRFPQALRDSITASLARDRKERGEWHGHAAVALLVVVDSLKSPTDSFNRRHFSTQLFPPSPETSGYCVTAIRIGAHAPTNGAALPPSAKLLDGCAFYDAFGVPGPEISKWLERQWYSHARYLSLAPPDSAPPRPAWPYEYSGAYTSRCGGGEQNACLLTIGQGEMDTTAMNAWNSAYEYRETDRSIPAWEKSIEWPLSSSTKFSNMQFLSDLARDLGPARFQRVWTSKLGLPEAYFEVSGETLAAWINRRVVAEYRQTYQIGPMPPSVAILAAVLACLTVLALSLRFSRRPYAM